MRTICLLTLLSSFAGIAEPFAPVHFAVIGDRTDRVQPGVFEEILTEVARLRPDFAVTVGDHIQGYTTDTSTLVREWNEFEGVVAGLPFPLHLTPGNHDITTDAQLPYYERYVGRPDYSFDEHGIHFTILDVSRAESNPDITREQLGWLVNDLRQSQKAAYRVVFYHKPFWQYTLAEGKPDTLHSIFRRYRVNAVFNGHQHSYFSAKYDSILYTAVGSSGGVSDSGPTGLRFHFVWVTVDSAGIHIAPIRMNSVLPWDEVTAANFVAIRNLGARGLSFTRRLPVDEADSVFADSCILKVRNPDSALVLDDTLRWTRTGAWTILPAALPVRLGPGDSASFAFSVRSMGTQIYPAPVAAIRMPYAPDRTVRRTKELPVVRRAYATRGTPTLDGKVNEAVWQNPVRTLFAPSGNPTPAEPTAFYFAWDDSNLYVAARAVESKPESLATRATDRDAAVEADDDVGYLLLPDTAAMLVYQLCFNPIGTIFDQKIDAARADPGWNANCAVRTEQGKDYWSVEARIPLAQFGVRPKPGMVLGINFQRRQQRRHALADWQVPVSTYETNRFGMLILR